jgi:hypothetical protein
MVIFRALSCCALMLGFMVPDDPPGLVSVSLPHEDAYCEDVRQPGLAFSVQSARDALTLEGRFDDFRFKRIIDRVNGHGFIGFHGFHFV